MPTTICSLLIMAAFLKSGDVVPLKGKLPPLELLKYRGDGVCAIPLKELGAPSDSRKIDPMTRPVRTAIDEGIKHKVPIAACSETRMPR